MVILLVQILDFQEAAKSVKDKYGYLNLLINASGILSIPGVLQPGRFVHIIFGSLMICQSSYDSFDYGFGEGN